MLFNVPEIHSKFKVNLQWNSEKDISFTLNVFEEGWRQVLICLLEFDGSRLHYVLFVLSILK